MYLSFSEPMYVNVTKKVLVDSVLECAHLCQTEENCEAFQHRDMYDDVNCQITQGEPRHLKMLGDNYAKEDWTLHLLQTVESVGNISFRNLAKSLHDTRVYSSYKSANGVNQ